MPTKVACSSKPNSRTATFALPSTSNGSPLVPQAAIAATDLHQSEVATRIVWAKKNSGSEQRQPDSAAEEAANGRLTLTVPMAPAGKCLLCCFLVVQGTKCRYLPASDFVSTYQKTRSGK